MELLRVPVTCPRLARTIFSFANLKAIALISSVLLSVDAASILEFNSHREWR